MKQPHETPEANVSATSRPKSETGGYYLALILLAIFVLYPRLSTGFTTQDDMNIALMAKHWSALMPFAWNFSTEQGRFFGVFLIVELAVPYLFDNRAYYYCVTISAIICNLACFYALIKLIFNREIAVLMLGFALAFLQNSWQHNPLTAYPFGYSIALSCLLGSFIAFAEWVRRGRLWSGILAGGLYFMALLTTEAFATYVVIFGCLSVAMKNDAQPGMHWLKAAAKAFLPIGLSLGLYTALHVGFTKLYPGRYEGLQLATVNPSRVIAVIWQYASSTLPGYFYFRDPAGMAVSYDGAAPPIWGFRQLLRDLHGDWLAKAVVLFWLCFSIVKARFAYLTNQQLRLLPLAILAIFLPVTLVGLTTKYQRWVLESNSLAGIHSYFAFFATVVVLGLLVLAGKRVVARWSRLVTAYSLAVAFLLALLSVATDSYNYYITRDQQLSDLKWRMIDEVASTPAIKEIPKHAVIYAPSLWNARGIVENLPDYWSTYLSWRTGKHLIVCRTLEEFNKARNKDPGSAIYFLSYYQEPKEPNQFMVVAEIPSIAEWQGETVYSRSITLYTYSKNKSFVLLGHRSRELSPVIRINGERIAKSDGDIFVHPVTARSLAGSLSETTIDSNVPINATALTISFFPILPYVDRFKIEYGTGFYPIEHDPQRHLDWCWTSGSAEMFVWNRTASQKDTCVTLRLMTLTTPQSVKISAGQHEESITFTDNTTTSEVSVPVSLVPGRNRISFTTDSLARPPANGDPRPIAFGVANAELCDVNKP